MIVKYKSPYELYYAHPGDAGVDLRAMVEITLPPRGYAKIPTGVYLEMPEDVPMGALLLPRSGLSAHGIVAQVGTIDRGYRGEISAILVNHNDEPYLVEIRDRIAQLVFLPVGEAELRRVDKIIDVSERSINGFGSTGKGADDMVEGVKSYVERRNDVLRRLDVEAFKNLFRVSEEQQDMTDDMALATMHRMRLEVIDMPQRLRAESKAWLEKRRHVKIEG